MKAHVWLGSTDLRARDSEHFASNRPRKENASSAAEEAKAETIHHRIKSDRTTIEYGKDEPRSQGRRSSKRTLMTQRRSQARTRSRRVPSGTRPFLWNQPVVEMGQSCV